MVRESQEVRYRQYFTSENKPVILSFMPCSHCVHMQQIDKTTRIKRNNSKKKQKQKNKRSTNNENRLMNNFFETINNWLKRWIRVLASICQCVQRSTHTKLGNGFDICEMKLRSIVIKYSTTAAKP